MGFRIDFSSQARSFLKRLPKEISLRITKKFREMGKNPFRYLRHYEGKYYKFRIGDYRALIDVVFLDSILYVEVLDKRGRVYK